MKQIEIDDAMVERAAIAFRGTAWFACPSQQPWILADTRRALEAALNPPPPPEPDIEVTEAMLKSGYLAWWNTGSDQAEGRRACAAIYRAMETERRKSTPAPFPEVTRAMKDAGVSMYSALRRKACESPDPAEQIKLFSDEFAAEIYRAMERKRAQETFHHSV